MSESGETPSVRASAEVTSPVLRSLEVEVDAKQVRKAFDRAYRDLAKKVSVKGFRPGKTPRSVLERLYGAAIAEDIERQLVAESLPEAVEQTAVTPVAEPSIDAAAPVAGESFKYVARIEVKPEVTAPDLSGLTAKRPATSVAEDEIDREIEGLRERRAPLADQPEETLVAEGHFVVIDYEGRVDGGTFAGGSGEGVTVEVGAGHFIPGFEEQLVGAAQGDEREIQVTFPEDYGSEELAGKAAVFTAKVGAVKQRELPELDDAFAKEMGEFESLEELRTRIREDFASNRERHARSEVRTALLDTLLERTEFEVPPGMVERRVEQRLEMAHRQLGQSLPHEELHARMGQWREEWRPAAEREVREDLILEAVAADQGLEASDAEIDEKLDAMAREQGIDAERLRSAYEEGGGRGALAGQISSEKALDLLIERAEIEEISES